MCCGQLWGCELWYAALSATKQGSYIVCKQELSAAGKFKKLLYNVNNVTNKQMTKGIVENRDLCVGVRLIYGWEVGERHSEFNQNQIQIYYDKVRIIFDHEGMSQAMRIAWDLLQGTITQIFLIGCLSGFRPKAWAQRHSTSILCLAYLWTLSDNCIWKLDFKIE